jgi:hypothetical protein
MTPSNRLPVHLLAGRSRLARDPAVAAALGVCGKPKPTVAYVGAASGDNAFFFGLMKKSLVASGAGRVDFVKLAGKRADVDRARRLLESADIVHVGGGDVEAGMEALVRRNMDSFLRGLLAEGKPFFGLSAGSIMLARAWVRWRDPDDEASAGLFPCLGFAPVYIDTHAEDEDFGELRSLLSLLPDGTTGYGLPSGTGLAVTANGTAQAVAGPVWRFAKQTGGIARLSDLR